MKTSTSFAAIEARSTYHGSCKKYFAGSRPDLNVPYREVSLSTTRHSDRVEQNAPVPVYDTSGPYTDPKAQIDVTLGLPPLRVAWIEDRQDTKELIGPSSEYARLREDDLWRSSSDSPPFRRLVVRSTERTSPRCTTPAKASLLRKWSLSRCVNQCG